MARPFLVVREAEQHPILGVADPRATGVSVDAESLDLAEAVGGVSARGGVGSALSGIAPSRSSPAGGECFGDGLTRRFASVPNAMFPPLAARASASVWRCGRGSPSAGAAVLGGRLLDGGKRLGLLDTDLANVTANDSTKVVGYRPVAALHPLAVERSL